MNRNKRKAKIGYLNGKVCPMNVWSVMPFGVFYQRIFNIEISTLCLKVTKEAPNSLCIIWRCGIVCLLCTFSLKIAKRDQAIRRFPFKGSRFSDLGRFRENEGINVFGQNGSGY
jgi:hypothetical protein